MAVSSGSATRRQRNAPPPVEAGDGRLAREPTGIPCAGWWQILTRAWNSMGRDNISLIASGVGFYGLLAIFPGLAALVSTYGLVANGAEVEREIDLMRGLLPQEATGLIAQQLHSLAHASGGSLSLGVVIGILLALWSARSGASALITALNIAYREEERRSLVMQYATALAMTVALLFFGILALALVAIMPAILNILPLGGLLKNAFSLLRWPILAALFLAMLACLYRYAPSRAAPRWYWVSPGAICATVLWLAVSALFSLYVAWFGSYDKTYGSLGAVVILLMWFYLSAYAVLFGAEINAESELQTYADTTDRPEAPLGRRHATVADHVAPPSRD
jgi:membrane protein